MKDEDERESVHTHTRIIPAFLYIIGLGWTLLLFFITIMVWRSPVLIFEDNKLILLTEILALTSILIAYLVYLPTIKNWPTVTPVRVCKGMRE